MSIADITPVSSGHLTLTSGPVPRAPVTAGETRPAAALWSRQPHRGERPGGVR
jgi:hypothetical protein